MSSDSALTPKWYTTAQVAELLGFGIYRTKALIEIVIISHGDRRRQAPPTDVSVASVSYGRWRGSGGKAAGGRRQACCLDVRAPTDLEIEPTLSTSTHR